MGAATFAGDLAGSGRGTMTGLAAMLTGAVPTGGGVAVKLSVNEGAAAESWVATGCGCGLGLSAGAMAGTDGCGDAL